MSVKGLVQAEKDLQDAQATVAKLEERRAELASNLSEVGRQLERVTDEATAVKLHGKQTALGNQLKEVERQLAEAVLIVKDAQHVFHLANSQRLDREYTAALHEFAVDVMALRDAATRLYELDTRREEVLSRVTHHPSMGGNGVFLRLNHTLESFLLGAGLATAHIVGVNTPRFERVVTLKGEQ